MTTPGDRLRALKGKVRDGVQRGAVEGMAAVQSAAIPLTPLGETGNLRGSSTLSPVVWTTTGLSITLAYTIVYARYQHENYGANFTTPGTGAGYLSKAVEQNTHTVKTILSNHIKAALR